MKIKVVPDPKSMSVSIAIFSGVDNDFFSFALPADKAFEFSANLSKAATDARVLPPNGK